jgi:hypothetical protein
MTYSRPGHILMRSFALTFFCLLFAAGCASQRPAASQKLYFAVELREQGRLVGKPKLVGETGKLLKVERRQPGAPQPDYQLVLMPTLDGDAFKIKLDVAVPRSNRSGHSDLDLLHGQERKIELGLHPGELEVKLTLMKVDSPEFRALMRLADPNAQGSGGSI